MSEAIEEDLVRRILLCQVHLEISDQSQLAWCRWGKGPWSGLL